MAKPTTDNMKSSLLPQDPLSGSWCSVWLSLKTSKLTLPSHHLLEYSNGGIFTLVFLTPNWAQCLRNHIWCPASCWRVHLCWPPPAPWPSRYVDFFYRIIKNWRTEVHLYITIYFFSGALQLLPVFLRLMHLDLVQRFILGKKVSIREIVRIVVCMGFVIMMKVDGV